MNYRVNEQVDPKAWNDFLLSLSPNTFLQSWEWGQVQQDTGEGIKYLAVFAGSEQIASALVVIVNAKRGRHYLIPHGPIFQLNPPPDKGRKGEVNPALEILTQLVAYLKQKAREDHVVALRVAPLLINTSANQQLFRDLGFSPAPLHVHAELTWVLDLSPTPEALLAGMRKTTRHAITKAARNGVSTEITLDASSLQRFLPLYTATKVRQHFIPFSPNFLQAQVDEFLKTNRLFFVFARYKNTDVAAAICFQFGPTVFYYHGASRPLLNSPPAAQLLQWTAIQEARRRGATRYNFWGIAPERQVSSTLLSKYLTPSPHPFSGITVFKKGFGGYAIDYLHAQDLPLSWRYIKLWLVDTYRKWHRGF